MVEMYRSLGTEKLKMDEPTSQVGARDMDGEKLRNEMKRNVLRNL